MSPKSTETQLAVISERLTGIEKSVVSIQTTCHGHHTKYDDLVSRLTVVETKLSDSRNDIQVLFNRGRNKKRNEYINQYGVPAAIVSVIELVIYLVGR